MTKTVLISFLEEKLSKLIPVAFFSALFIFCTAPALGQKSTIKLKDGSRIHAEIVKETTEHIVFIFSNGDTLQLAHKHIDEVIGHNSAFKESGIKEYYLFDGNSKNLFEPQMDKYHHTKGDFVNLDLFGFPFAMEIGKRFSPNLNFGGKLLYANDEDSNILALTSYVQKFLSTNQYKTKAYIEGYAGIGYRTDESLFREFNKFPFVGGAAFGMVIPNKKRVKIYFEAGFYTVYSERRDELVDPFGTIISERRLLFFPQVTALGLQF